MTKRVSLLLLTAAVVSGTGAFAEVPLWTRQIGGLASTDAAQSTSPRSATVRLPGTIEKYDASTRMLSLTTSNGTVRFPLASAVRIRRGGQTIEASELAALSGYRATVRYSESGGTKTVESVHVFGK